jgi:hypothetical protein
VISRQNDTKFGFFPKKKEWQKAEWLSGRWRAHLISSSGLSVRHSFRDTTLSPWLWPFFNSAAIKRDGAEAVQDASELDSEAPT